MTSQLWEQAAMTSASNDGPSSGRDLSFPGQGGEYQTASNGPPWQWPFDLKDYHSWLMSTVCDGMFTDAEFCANCVAGCRSGGFPYVADCFIFWNPATGNCDMEVNCTHNPDLALCAGLFGDTGSTQPSA